MPSFDAPQMSADDDGLETMLGATSTIGRAVALLKQRDGLDDEAAFTRLVKLAEEHHARLRDIAASVLSDADDGGA